MAWRGARRLFAFLKNAGMTSGPIIDNRNRPTSHFRIFGSQDACSRPPAPVLQMTDSHTASVRVHSPAQSIPSHAPFGILVARVGHGKQDQTARVGPRSQWRLTPNIFFSLVKGSALRCGLAHRESVSLSDFSSNYHPVPPHSPRVSLVSTHLSCGISGQADIGSTSSFKPSERDLINPFVQPTRSLHGSSLSSAPPLPPSRAGVRLFP